MTDAEENLLAAVLEVIPAEWGELRALLSYRYNLAHSRGHETKWINDLDSKLREIRYHRNKVWEEQISE